MANTSRNISRACGKTSDEADVMHQAMDQHNQGICEESRCDTSGCKLIQSSTLRYIRLQVDMIGYLVVYQVAGQYLSGTLKAGAVHQAVRWNEMNKSDL
jgi:hypothetical protein